MLKNRKERLDFLLKTISSEAGLFDINYIIAIANQAARDSWYDKKEILRKIGDKYHRVYGKMDTYEEDLKASFKEIDDENKRMSTHPKGMELCKQFMEIEDAALDGYHSSLLNERSYKFWNKKSGWLIEEFLALKFNRNPDSFSSNEIVTYEFIIKTQNIDNITQGYSDLALLIENAIVCEELRVVGQSPLEKKMI